MQGEVDQLSANGDGATSAKKQTARQQIVDSSIKVEPLLVTKASENLESFKMDLANFIDSRRMLFLIDSTWNVVHWSKFGTRKEKVNSGGPHADVILKKDKYHAAIVKTV